MAQNIVGGLFGITPQDVYDSYAAQDRQTAVDLMNSPTLAQMGIYYGSQIGSGLGRGVASLLGAEDPRLQQAKIMAEAQQQGFDVTTPEGLQQLAQFFVQRGQPGLASQVAQQVQNMQSSALTMQEKQMNIEAKQRGIKNMEGLRAALSQLPENADRKMFINTILPFMDSADDAIKLASSKYGFEQDGTENITGQAGPLAKGGYRDIYGTTYQGGDFAKLRNEYTTYVDTLNSLNSISEQEAKDAVSFIDYSTKPSEIKALGGKTTSAQTKIAVDQIFSQLRALPPGPASDADMAAAKSTFPGYGDEESLKKWIDEQKIRILTRVNETRNRFGNTGIFGQTIPEFKPMSNFYKSQEKQKKKAAAGVPDKASFIAAARARPENKQYTDKQLSDYYDQEYGE